MEQHFKSLEEKGVRYIVKQAEKNDNLYNKECLGNKDVLALTEVEPSFDAANILRDNDNLYYLVSNSGNEAGARYLQELVGPDKKVWPIKGLYSFMHLDSTIALLREGLMLLNPSRVKSIDQLPKPLQSWDYIYAPEPQDIGHFPGYCNASPWLNMNLFSISPNLVALHKSQDNLRIILEKKGIECAMLPGRQQRTLGGGFHCVTLDLERKH
jgi:glycine amidinotransferase/scyllo-inosamine-4-phosphate amidinotransferase 1